MSVPTAGETGRAGDVRQRSGGTSASGGPGAGDAGSHGPGAVTRPQRIFGLLLALVSGLGVALQARINGELAGRLGDGVLAAVVSFGSGLVIVVVLLAMLPRARAGLRGIADAVRGGSLKPWQLIGGVAGAFLVAAQGLTVGALGVALFTVGMVAGQTASGLLVDRLGLGPAGPQAVTWNRIVGVVLAVVAVGGSVAGQISGNGALWLLVLPLLAGFGTAVQQAINGRVRAAAGHTLTATFVNFVAGTAALVVFWLAALPFRPAPDPFPGEWWLYLGGLVGVGFISMAAFVVRWTGVLLLGLSTVCGQLIGAVVLDLVAPAHGEQLRLATVLGVLVTLVAVGLAALPGRRRTTRPTTD